VRTAKRSRCWCARRGICVSIAICLLFATGLCETANPREQAAEHWRKLTIIDVEAAHALLQNNHPAAALAAEDAPFRSALDRAYMNALARAGTVTSYEGYVATVGEFANALGDGHIWSHPLFFPRTVEWAGLIAARHGEHWIVVNEDDHIEGPPLIGSRIVSCDGQAADELANNVLHYRATAVEAEQVLKSGWLLVDEHNPFLQRPRSCIFEFGGKQATRNLSWSTINRNTLLTQYWKKAFGEAGFSVRQIGASFWIAIQELTPKAQPVIDAITTQKETIRSSRYVVVDLRGNDGGNSAYGRLAAEALYGEDYVASILGPKNDVPCPSVYRASEENIEAASDGIRRFEKEGDSHGAEAYTHALHSMQAALSRGEYLTGAPSCQTQPPKSSQHSSSLLRAKVFVLTDAACFSSCIKTVGDFIKFGAIQIGEPTGAVTHYSEVRELVLPSGLSTFSTLMAIMPDAPIRFGPFVPTYEFGGDISNTADLERWVREISAEGTGNKMPQ
jgi:hypothetical protein